MITVRNLWYLAGGKQILRGVDLNVEKGEILAIMGVSGGGKTSLLKCIGGLVEATAGSIIIGGVETLGIPEREKARIRRRMGMVFQYAALFDSLTVYDNIAFALRWHRLNTEDQIKEIVRSRLAMVGMSGTESQYPAELSGGMRKRVGLARALALNPEILLYDEPTSGLDPVIAGAIDELIVKTRQSLGVTSVVVSHDVDSIFRISDRVAMLHNGRIEEVGSPEQLKASTNPVVRQFIRGETIGPIQLKDDG
jgi:phospholipid/cholesterol/gamma-HCH transport system ATP-binding protein